ncbi:DmsE family decaheme c-type cytochrome [Marinimicrobium sp. LS-A18]|uniref:DmsE family decaheme c-type cytochrome n=1 Tax=Marinimicrobium sp. LS-A18 TaxID=1381596 RepID=UPI0004649B71|nr:DmsE family decaheme c-type cytochrome [Marinimicrobium sp. LS-A18]
MHHQKIGTVLLGIIWLAWASVGWAQDSAYNVHANLPDDPAVCAACHKEDSLGLLWSGSAHHRAEVSCVACHQDLAKPTPQSRVRGQTQVCMECHTDVRADMHRPFGHPLRNGQMHCTDCHAPHGGPGPAELIQATVNDQCYQCHAETRGPFLWEHAPVTEDCGHCHKPHGSNHRALLQARTPWLCQQCHMAAFHPSSAETGMGVPPNGASSNLLGKDCANCHSQVHGSNHPSGSGLTR